MSLGFPQTKNDWDNRAGQLAITLRNTLTDIQRFQTLLTATPDVNLTGLGYSSTEVAQMKSAFTDLNDLARIYSGLASAKTLPYDYTTFAKLLTGVV